ncbi:hypothetical protein DVH24_019501 [Malus domestica]|uniref:Uncharacterized protein n=1 Tax=Malus domestica TaxID=3750 RepID=A0A498I675_MALDO|nr:hypothetical protein DVH24_019501 [Malus domestica]
MKCVVYRSFKVACIHQDLRLTTAHTGARIWFHNQRMLSRTDLLSNANSYHASGFSRLNALLTRERIWLSIIVQNSIIEPKSHVASSSDSKKREATQLLLFTTIGCFSTIEMPRSKVLGKRTPPASLISRILASFSFLNPPPVVPTRSEGTTRPPLVIWLGHVALRTDVNGLLNTDFVRALLGATIAHIDYKEACTSPEEILMRCYGSCYEANLWTKMALF